jgi:hypothetical protein
MPSTNIMIVIGVSAGCLLFITGNPWALLPVLPLAAMVLTRSWPGWARALVMHLAQPALYASLAVWLFLVLDLLLGSRISPSSYQEAENLIFDARNVLDELANPLIMLPLIALFGAISFANEDARLMRRFGKLAGILSTAGLTMYTLSLFTLFTAVQADDKVHDMITKYNLVIDAEKKAVGKYLSATSLKDALDHASKEQRDAFAQLVETLARLHQGAAELRSMAPDPMTAYHSSDYFVSKAIQQQLERQLPEASKIILADDMGHVRKLDARELRGFQSQATQNINVASRQADTLNVALESALGSVLNSIGLDEYTSSVLSDLSNALLDKYFAPKMESWVESGNPLLHSVADIAPDRWTPVSEALKLRLNAMSATLRPIGNRIIRAVAQVRKLTPEERAEWFHEYIHPAIPPPVPEKPIEIRPSAHG